MATLTNIVNTENNSAKAENFEANINKYIIELIRISKMYKFELKVKPRTVKKSKLENTIAIQRNIEEQIKKVEIKEEINEYSKRIKVIIDEPIETTYNTGTVKIKEEEYKIEKPKNIKYQELWEKEGFYQERTTQVRVRVQLWPEHLPYDHFKRKRAFLFC